MIKKLICSMAIIAGLVSCNDDYTDWANPQSNAANEAAEKFTMLVTPSVSSVDFATETAENIQLFSTNLQDGQASEYTVTFSTEDNTGTATVTATKDGTVSAEDLKNVVSSIYGKAPYERTFNATVSADVKITTADGSVVSEKSGEPFTLKLTLSAPYISEHYYLVGAPSSWSPTETSMPFSHSDQNVYDDPVFTVTFPVADGETWFAIADDKTIASGEWSDLLGCAEGNGKNGMEGKIIRRTELSDEGSWVVNVAGDAKFIKMTINMMDYTYTLEKLNFGAYIYEIGNESGWSVSHPLAGLNYDGQYMGFAYLNGEFKYKPNADNWDNDYEKVSGDAYEGTLTTDGGPNIDAISEGFYMMQVDAVNMTYKHTLISTIGVIGDATADGWNSDQDMTFDATDSSWNISGITLTDGTIKFRANDAWDINWGGDTAGLVANGDNISVTAGTYDIKLIPICDGMSSCTLTKK